MQVTTQMDDILPPPNYEKAYLQYFVNSEMLPNFCNGHRAQGHQEVINVMDILGHLKLIGKFDNFDPMNLKSANGYKIRVSAVCCSPYSGYMDSKVVTNNYTIGNEASYDDPNRSRRPDMKPVIPATPSVVENQSSK